MYFTREPIIQTIISARDGYTICLRSLTADEEVYVDVVELVTFDTIGFYRCTEKGTSYLFPVLNYQVLEERIQSMVLKTSATRKDKEIKIGKGKEETPAQKEDKKKSRKKNKLRQKENFEARELEKEFEEPIEASKIEPPKSELPKNDAPKKPVEKKEKPPASRFLIPPPESLISESLHKAAMKRGELSEQVFVPTVPEGKTEQVTEREQEAEQIDS